MAKEVKRRRGRPSIPEGERKRQHLTLRVRDQTKRSLEYHANANQRSLSEEAEARLEISFGSEKVLHEALELAYGKQLAGLFLLLTRAMDEAGGIAAVYGNLAKTGWSPGIPPAPWLQEPYAFDQVAKAAVAILEAIRPSGDPSPPKVQDRITREYLADLGPICAGTIVWQLKIGPEPFNEEDVEFCRAG